MSPFNRSSIDWVSVIALSLLLLIAGRMGERGSLGNRSLGALVTTLLFAIGFCRLVEFTARHGHARVCDSCYRAQPRMDLGPTRAA
jgi:hypothetical protein